MKINFGDIEYNLLNVPITFIEHDIDNIFSRYNRKTLGQTLALPRYAKSLHATTYKDYLGWDLGRFLLHLKEINDPVYKEFLNPYGDRTFCKFKVLNDETTDKKGIYFYYVSGELKYIGRCRDSFNRRFNAGYGTIFPKNCYIDGQRTNCRLNTLINDVRESIKLYVYCMSNNQEIEELETSMIQSLNPSWNIQHQQNR